MLRDSRLRLKKSEFLNFYIYSGIFNCASVFVEKENCR